MRRLVAILLLLLPGAGRADDASIVASLIPFDSLTATNRALVKTVTDHYTLRRSYSAQQFKGRKDEFEWLLSHMEACSVLAQKVGLITYRARDDGHGRLYADNREGSQGFLVLVYGSPTNDVFYVEGSNRGLFAARGRGVAVVNFSQKSPHLMEYTGAVYVKVDNAMLAELTHLFAIFLRGAVDRQFDHVLSQPVKLCELAQTEPKKVLGHIDQMPERDRALLRPFAELLASQSSAPAQTVSRD